MPKYIIEREAPGAGRMSASELRAMSQKSCSVVERIGPDLQWIESFVTDDKLYCIYIAANADLIREHAALGGFPVNRISEIRTIIDPAAV